MTSILKDRPLLEFLKITQGQQKSHPHNHCVPLYEVLDVPDTPGTSILVFPLLQFNDEPQFETVGEVIDYFRQVFEGLQFMHHHNVAHRDLNETNIMMNPKPIFPKLLIQFIF
ncbi:hypothetical protein C8Q75DRAFT_808135 [Abortiporus biennis]|nr:hypothetical protein C8Q75DRAFT_808135 [Abortiporus biennis]